MSLRAMFSGLSGMKNHLTAIDVVGNNIANINTIGFKSSRVQFQDILSQTVSGATSPTDERGGRNPQQVGLGMNIGSIDVIHTQGNLQNTGNITDLAIQGAGFFVLADGEERVYTRAGNFTFDRNGIMVHSSGRVVQGWNAESNGDINTSTSVDSITVPVGQTIPAKSTTSIDFNYNLDSESDVIGSAKLQAGNTAGVVLVQGIWDKTYTDASSNDVETTDEVGTHTLTIASKQITVGGLSATGTLTAEGVTDAEDFQIDVDGGSVAGGQTKIITGLTITSTIEELVIAINSQVPGVTAVYSSGNMVLSRDRAGNDTDYDIELSGNIYTNVFLGVEEEDEAAATVVYQSLDGLSSISSTTLTFGTGSQTITGMNGVTISAGSTGYFKEGNAVVSTVAAETHITSTNVYDSLGKSHPVKITFERTSNNNWTWVASSDTGDVSGQGVITFSSNGTIATGVTGTLTVSSSGGAEALGITPVFSAISQYSGPSTVLASDQDGYAAGTLESFSIGQDGVISGLYDNGKTRNLGQLSMANFANPTGLLRDAGSVFRPSNNSGEAQVGTVNTGGRGTISSGTLEMSNIDLAQEFANLITYQRGFQSSAKMITAGDEMLQVLVGLKR